jgi:uncharacterized membrane protein YozB (DUF420 family)
MVSGVTKLILMLVIFSLPFQLLGVAAYFVLVKSDLRRAHIAGVIVPAATFFLTFLVLYLWCCYHSGMLMLAEGAINLFILVVMVTGTTSHLVGGAIVHFILYRKKDTGMV